MRNLKPEPEEYKDKSTADLILQVQLNFHMFGRLNAALREVKREAPNCKEAKALEKQIDMLNERQQKILEMPRIEAYMRAYHLVGLE